MNTQLLDSKADASVSSAKIMELYTQNEKQSFEGRRTLLKFVGLTFAIANAGFVFGTIFGTSLSTPIFGIIPPVAITILTTVTTIAATVFAWRATTSRMLDYIGYCFVGALLVAFTLNGIGNKMTSSFPAVFVVIPTIAGFFSLKVRFIVALNIVTGTILAALLIWSRTAFGTSPATAPFEIAGWLSIFTVLCGGVTIFVDRVDKTRLRLTKQTEQMALLLQTLSNTTQVGVSLSQSLTQITGELDRTSREQAGSTQEQVAAVTQVTTSLEELNETAGQIANNAQSASRSVEQAFGVANRVKESSQLAEATTKRGTNAVEQTLQSVEHVRNRIELLGQRLLNLTEQTRRVGNIIDLIDEIADETHLLALNASIEAAGSMSGETNVTGTSRQGARFGVIAQEIKNLSDRSREATEEVRQAIGEMQGAVAAAVLVAEEGKKETAAALSRSQISGAVIGQLNEVIAASAASADEILKTIATVRDRCDEISLATSQQRSANQQILATMRGVALISQQSAGTVVQLSSTVSLVNRQVDELNLVLTRAPAELTLSA